MEDRFNISQYVSPSFVVLFVFLVAVIATSGSLYLSLGLGLFPCQLCWYQRILMYPLVLMSLYSYYYNISPNGLFLLFSGFGLLIATYHSYIQAISVTKTVCSSLCSKVLYTVGPFTIPNLSAIAFALIFLSILPFWVREVQEESS